MGKSIGHYLKSGLWGVAIGAVATAIPFGVGALTGGLAGAVGAAGGVAGVLGGAAAIYTAYTVGAVLLTGLFVVGFLKNNIDGFDGIKFRTLIPGIVAGGYMAATTLTHQLKKEAAPATELPAKTVVSDAFNTARALDSKKTVALFGTGLDKENNRLHAVTL